MLFFSLTMQTQNATTSLSLLRAICMHKTGAESLEEETSKLLTQYFNINPKVTGEIFRGVCFENLHIVERLAEVKILV